MVSFNAKIHKSLSAACVTDFHSYYIVSFHEMRAHLFCHSDCYVICMIVLVIVYECSIQINFATIIMVNIQEYERVFFDIVYCKMATHPIGSIVAIPGSHSVSTTCTDRPFQSIPSRIIKIRSIPVVWWGFAINGRMEITGSPRLLCELAKRKNHLLGFCFTAK